MIRMTRMADRRHIQKRMVLVERRKGKLWMYGEIGLCVWLIYYLATLVK